jgi:signal peptidase I
MRIVTPVVNFTFSVDDDGRRRRMAAGGLPMTAEQGVIRVARALVTMMVVGIGFSQPSAAQSPTFQRGEQVRIKAPTKPSDPKQSDMVLIVVAVPNDRIRLSDSAVYVNETLVTGFSQDFLGRVARTRTPDRVPQTVPEGHYFVMGEARTNGNISEYFGQHPVARLETAR